MRKILCMVGRADVMNHQGGRKGWCLKFWGKEPWRISLCLGQGRRQDSAGSGVCEAH